MPLADLADSHNDECKPIDGLALRIRSDSANLADSLAGNNKGVKEIVNDNDIEEAGPV